MLLEQCIRGQYKCTGMCNKENTSWKFRDIIDPTTSEIALLPSTAQPDCTECLYKYRNNNCTMALHAAPWLSERLSSSVTPNAAKMPLMRDAIVFCILHLTILFTEERALANYAKHDHGRQLVNRLPFPFLSLPRDCPCRSESVPSMERDDSVKRSWNR